MRAFLPETNGKAQNQKKSKEKKGSEGERDTLGLQGSDPHPRKSRVQVLQHLEQKELYQKLISPCAEEKKQVTTQPSEPIF